MTEHDLQKTVLVASAPVRIALAAPQAKPAAAISIDTINGRPAAIDRVIDLHDEIAIVEGEHSALETPNTIWLGINTFRDERWTFHRAETVEGEASRWRASIQLPRGRRISGPDGLNAEMVAIVAPGMLGAGQVQRDWSDSFIVAKSSPALLHLSEEPWGANLLSSITSTLALPTFDSFGLASVVLPPWEDWLFPLFGALLAILLLRRASLRARWSGFRDGRKNVPHAGAPQPGPAEVEIMATVDARLQRRLQPIRSKCAHLKAQFDVYQITHERHLLEYDRLRRKPEQYFFRPGWAPWMRHTILLLLTVGELFFNTSAFEVIGKDRVGTLIMALGLGIAIPVCAYVLGIAVASYEVEPRKATGLKIFIYAFALVLALLGISWIRGRSMAYDAVFAREGLSGAGGEAIGAFTTWDIPIIYFIFNLLIVIAAAALAYAAADARGDAAEATRRTQSLENRLANLRSGLQRLKTKEASLRARADRESRRLIALYRSTNLRWRKSEAPAHFWAPMTAIVIADEPAESPIASAAHRGNGGSDGIKTEMPV